MLFHPIIVSLKLVCSFCSITRNNVYSFYWNGFTPCDFFSSGGRFYVKGGAEVCVFMSACLVLFLPVGNCRLCFLYFFLITILFFIFFIISYYYLLFIYLMIQFLIFFIYSFIHCNLFKCNFQIFNISSSICLHYPSAFGVYFFFFYQWTQNILCISWCLPDAATFLKSKRTICLSTFSTAVALWSCGIWSWKCLSEKKTPLSRVCTVLYVGWLFHAAASTSVPWHRCSAQSFCAAG